MAVLGRGHVDDGGACDGLAGTGNSVGNSAGAAGAVRAAVWSYDATPCRWSCYTESSGHVGDVLEQAREAWREQIEQLE